MTLTLGLRTLLLIAFVAAATSVLLHPGLATTGDTAAHAMLMVGTR